MASIGEVSESVGKRAQTGEGTFLSNKNDDLPRPLRSYEQTSASNDLRANQISTRLFELLKEFPEMKFILDFEYLQASIENAVVKYVEEKEAAQLLLNYGQNTEPFYSLPDEILINCLSYVGKGHYGVVSLVSKKLNEAYKENFGKETAYLEMATSIKLSNYCLSDLCKTLLEKDELLKAAAVNGNLDILRAAVKDGYDLFPLIAMKKETILDEDYRSFVHVYHADDSEVKLSKLVERGHLHVLVYLHEELNYFLGLQRYFKPVIEYGKLEILEWLDDIGITEDDSLCIGHIDDGNLEILDFCECAIKSGNVESLNCLMTMGYMIDDDYFDHVLPEAIRSKSTDMIQYCFDIGSDNLTWDGVQDAIKETRSVEVYRKMYELGYEFSSIQEWYCYSYSGENFEIIKFLRSISVPWDDGIMKDIVVDGTLEMIEYARNEGCPWTTDGDEYTCLLRSNSLSLEKLNYLIDNGCIFDYEHSSGLIDALNEKKELVLLDYFVGKNAHFDNKLFRGMSNYHYSEIWTEGISYLLEHSKDAENFYKTIEEVFREHTDIDRIKYFHGLGFSWCLDSSRNTQLLSKIACYNNLDDVNWAYENGCKGGYLVPFVKEEWEDNGIRQSNQWKMNQVFFEKNGMLDKTFLEKSELYQLNFKNIQEIGDSKLESFVHFENPNLAWFNIDYSLLRTLVEHGYTFRSKLEKESVTKEAYIKCCESYLIEYDGYRKRLVLFVGMEVRKL